MRYTKIVLEVSSSLLHTCPLAHGVFHREQEHSLAAARDIFHVSQKAVQVVDPTSQLYMFGSTVAFDVHEPASDVDFVALSTQDIAKDTLSDVFTAEHFERELLFLDQLRHALQKEHPEYALSLKTSSRIPVLRIKGGTAMDVDITAHRRNSLRCTYLLRSYMDQLPFYARWLCLVVKQWGKDIGLHASCVKASAAKRRAPPTPPSHLHQGTDSQITNDDPHHCCHTLPPLPASRSYFPGSGGDAHSRVGRVVIGSNSARKDTVKEEKEKEEGGVRGVVGGGIKSHGFTLLVIHYLLRRGFIHHVRSSDIHMRSIPPIPPSLSPSSHYLRMAPTPTPLLKLPEGGFLPSVEESKRFLFADFLQFYQTEFDYEREAVSLEPPPCAPPPLKWVVASPLLIPGHHEPGYGQGSERLTTNAVPRWKSEEDSLSSRSQSASGAPVWATERARTLRRDMKEEEEDGSSHNEAVVPKSAYPQWCHLSWSILDPMDKAVNLGLHVTAETVRWWREEAIPRTLRQYPPPPGYSITASSVWYPPPRLGSESATLPTSITSSSCSSATQSPALAAVNSVACFTMSPPAMQHKVTAGSKASDLTATAELG